MKYVLGILLLIAILTSCIPSKHEIWINKDMSGKLEQTYDLEKSIKVLRRINSSKEDYAQDEMAIRMIKSMAKGERKRDTTINFVELLKDKPGLEKYNTELLKKIFLHLSMYPEEVALGMKIEMNFKDLDEYKEINEMMRTLDKEFKEKETDTTTNFFPKMKYLSSRKNIQIEITNPMYRGNDTIVNTEEVIEMVPDSLREKYAFYDELKMMLDWEIDYIFHLPKRIKKISDKKLLQDKKTARFTYKPFNKVTNTDKVIELKY